ncbi:MAG: SusC/RagA family TonB-linked outer membrane protein [Saprospiraceae bacterium]|jgi:TonB-linked SusC/RagA family outer membrane protein|nr:SusC/RagA family TonB-linked outer membrane protein [Saprospiraceae bacterium]
MKQLLLSILILFGGISMTLAQKTVSGKVTDSAGEAVIGANVLVKEASGIGTITDIDGMFSLSIPPDAKTLVFSYTGYETKEIVINDQAVINTTLTQGRLLEEVVVTATGIKKDAREIGYSYAKVSNDDVINGRSPQLAQALSGKVAGLAVYNVNNSVDPQAKIVLRGYRSLTGNNDALIVVDGLQTTATILSVINPNDIENVSILKGGQAATLFGSAGINGALVITTKKGSKGKLKVNLSQNYNLDEISFLPQFQDKFGNGSHYATSFGSAGYKTDYLERLKDNWRPFENQQYGDAFNGETRIVGRVLEDGTQYNLPYAAIPNVRKKAFDIGHTSNTQLSFQGGDDNGTYYLSLEHNDISGIVPKDKSKRDGARLSATKNYGKLTTGYNMSYVQANYDRTTSDFYSNMINTPANVPLGELRDWKTNKFANPNGYFNDYIAVPFFTLDNNRTKYKDANIQGNVELGYKVADWLTLSNRIGVMNNSRTQKSWTGKFIHSDWAKNSAFVPAPWDWANDYDGIDRAGTDILGSVTDRSTTENVINDDLQAQLKKSVGKFDNRLVLGYNLYMRNVKFLQVGSNSVVVPDVYNVSNRQGELTGFEGNSQERKFGYYADLTTSFNRYLTLNATFRNDNTSRFYKADRPKSNWSYNYYGAALAFVVTEAMPSLSGDVLSYAKLRASINKNGNDNLPIYGLDLTYPNGAGFPYGTTVGLSVGDVLPDANLKPEFVTSKEIGGEFRLFKSRVILDVTAYTQQSKGQVITVKIPNTTGFPNLLINVGESKNWGYESDLKIALLQNTKLKWDIGVRYSYNDNKVVDLFPNVNSFQLADGFSYANTNIIKNERFPMLKSDGYVYAPDGSGRRLVNSASGYPLRDATLTNRGGVLPRHTLGFTNKLELGDLAFSFNLEYRGGNVFFSDLGRQMTFTGSGKWTDNRAPHIFPNSAILGSDGTTVSENTVNVREPEYGLWVDNYRLISENFVVPGWFIKVRDISLTYNLPTTLLTKLKFVSGGSVTLYGRNLITIVDKLNYYTDPEFSRVTNGGDLSSLLNGSGLGNGVGISSTGQTPPVRQYGISLNFGF